MPLALLGLRVAVGARYSAVVEASRRKAERRPVKWRWVRDTVLLIVESSGGAGPVVGLWPG